MIINSAGKPIRYISFEIVAGESKGPVTVRVTAQPGATLLSEQHDSITLKARERGTIDAYVDLAEGIDLSGYTPGGDVDFDLVCEASEELTGLIRIALFLGDVKSGGAAWAA